MVFQNYALFPHMTVAENIAFPLKMRSVDAASETRARREALEHGAAAARGAALSERAVRRAAAAHRAGALPRLRPAIVLMDEPLGALDKKLRDQMQLEIKRIHRELGTTDHLRHARPGRGDDDVGPHLPDERRARSSSSARRRTSTSAPTHRCSSPTSSASPTCSRAGAGRRRRGSRRRRWRTDGGARHVRRRMRRLPRASKVRVMVRPQNIAPAANGAAAAARPGRRRR